MDTLRIQTAQNVDLAFATAGLGDRLLAWLFDTVIWVAYAIAVTFALNETTAPGYARILAYLPALLYYPAFEIFFNGQTPGKRARKLRVACLDGAAPTLGQHVLRWLLRWVDVTLSSGSVAFIAVAVTRHGQRLGDLAAGTTVIKAAARVDFVDVQYPILPKNYAPRFPQSESLADADIRTLRAVLVRMSHERDAAASAALARRAKAAVEDRLGLGEVDLPPERFLRTVVDDYTSAHDRYG